MINMILKLLLLLLLPQAVNAQVTEEKKQGLAAPEKKVSPEKKAASVEKKKGAALIPPGRELVKINFPQPVDINHIIASVAKWTGKTVVLDEKIRGKIQIISPNKFTGEEAYEAFLSALSVLGYTTTENNNVVRIIRARDASKGTVPTYLGGGGWVPATEQIISYIMPLKYIDATQLQRTLRNLFPSNTLNVYTPTNSLIAVGSGHKIQQLIDIASLLDVRTRQPKVLFVPIENADPKEIVAKVKELLLTGNRKTSPQNKFKLLVEDRSNSVVIFGPPQTADDVRALVKKFDVPLQEDNNKPSIHVRPLDYADAKTLAKTLSSLISSTRKGSSGGRRPPTRGKSSSSLSSFGDGVKITAEPSTNSLLIVADRNQNSKIGEFLRKIDVRKPQVYIKTHIIDISENNGFKAGASVFFGAGSQTGTKAIIGWEAKDMAPLIVAGASSGTTSTSQIQNIAGSFASDMTIGVLAGKSIKVPGLGEFSPGALIKLLKTDSNNRAISSPHILTLNNQEAVMSSGEKVFYETASSPNPTTGLSIPKIEHEKVDLSLKIKPSISHSNYVTLKIDIDSNSLGEPNAKTGVPNVIKRKTVQTVTVKNGQMVVITGLNKSIQTSSHQKIPFLGDIPIIGNFFRNSVKREIQSKLLVFLETHIIHGPADLTAVYEKSLNERDEFLQQIYGSSYSQEKFFKHMPTPADGAYRPDPIDKIEEKARYERHQEILKVLGYAEKKQAQTQSPRKEEELRVPGSLDFDTGTSVELKQSPPLSPTLPEAAP